ncbi:MAG: hypothetical protein NC393_04075 [Clostridium sp.]|nr:hypothetical protein [Clostridium sp.]MCM1171286.1 hypothetical protein [Clostridium sp.]MCM1207444.1 hypothetical protein [Ruminococcus sp.]
MGLIDRIRQYLNEEDIEANQEDIGEAEADWKEKKPARRLFLKKEKKKKLQEKPQEEENAPSKKGVPSPGVNSELYNSLSGGASENERKNAADFCEQLIDITYYAEDMKREYQLVTSYLTDIQRLEELPESIKNDLEDTARKIEMLDDNRQTYLKSENLLSMECYNKIASLEKSVPDTIRKLIDMEQQDTLLKNDMSYLEGEKEDLKYLHTEYAADISRTRGAIAAILALFLVVVGILLIVSIATKKNVTVYCLGVGLFAMLCFVIAYVRYLGFKTDITENDAKLKRAVSLLNKVKVKFINNTNALDYIYEKYRINSSKELEYEWDLYNTMVRDSIKYTQANSDYRIYCDELVERLKKLGLMDPFVWVKQTKALIDHREMVEITHGLNVRRQKIREKLASCDKIKTNANVALRAAIDANPGLKSYIKDQLASYNIKLDEAENKLDETEK